MELPPSLVLTNSEPDIEGVFVFEHGELMSSTIDVSIDESPPSPDRTSSLAIAPARCWMSTTREKQRKAKLRRRRPGNMMAIQEEQHEVFLLEP